MSKAIVTCSDCGQEVTVTLEHDTSGLETWGQCPECGEWILLDTPYDGLV